MYTCIFAFERERESIKNFVDIIFLVFIKISIFNGYTLYLYTLFQIYFLFRKKQASFVM